MHQEKKKKIEQETSFSNLVTVLEYSLELAALNIALNQRPLDLQQILICYIFSGFGNKHYCH